MPPAFRWEACESTKDRAEVVIIGAGIVGCSAAYHLSKLGIRDVVVVDKGSLYKTGGSTSHAPGLVFQTNSSRTMTKFSEYTVDLFSRLELDGKPCYQPVGGMEVACTEQRMTDLKRKLGVARAWGIEARLLDAGRAAEKLPLLDKQRIYGAFFVPTDGIAKPIWAGEVMAREAESTGASFVGETTVTGIKLENKRVKEVVTTGGSIATENVLLCAGIWGPQVGRLAGATVPLLPMQHQYARTSPLKELAGETREVSHPILRHQDKSMYFRQHKDRYGVGSYNHEPIPVNPDDSHLSATMSFTPEMFGDATRAAVELIPALGKVGLEEMFNGVFSFTQDGFPVIGESSQVHGLWVAEAIWITHSAGAAKAVAEWMVEGVPSLDLRECDVNRFQAHSYSPEYVRIRAIEGYREVYSIVHPLQPMTRPRNLRLTPFHERLRDLGAFFLESAGWERPQWFEGNRSRLDEFHVRPRTGWEARYWSPVQGVEHLTTRARAAVYDLTPFAKLKVSGPGSLRYMGFICANDVNKPHGRVVYTSMLNKKGGIVCDLTVTRFDEDEFLVITGGATAPHDLAWMRQHLPRDGSVTIEDVSSAYCCLGLWGPEAPEILRSLTEEDLSKGSFPAFTARRIMVGSVPVLALRVSYVGEPGWELYTQNSYGLTLWDSVWKAGSPLGLIAGGLGAFDSLRLEKGFRLWGSDIHTEYNPFEAGLGFAVRLEKGDFLGRDALMAVKEKGIQRRLCRMYFEEPGMVVMGKEPILSGGRVLGYITSSNYGYALDRGICYGYLPIDFAKGGTNVQVMYFGETHGATVVAESE